MSSEGAPRFSVHLMVKRARWQGGLGKIKPLTIKAKAERRTDTRTTRSRKGSPEDIVLKQQTFTLDDFFDFFLSVPGFHICFQIDQI